MSDWYLALFAHSGERVDEWNVVGVSWRSVFIWALPVAGLFAHTPTGIRLEAGIHYYP